MSRLKAHYSTLAPEAFKKLLDYSQAAHKIPAGSSIDTNLLELVNLRVSQLNGCAYCVDMHTRTLLEEGEDAQRLALLPVWHESTFFTPRERAALGWAERLNAKDEETLDASYTELTQHFSESDIVHLCFAVAVINNWNIMNVGLKTAVARKPLPEAKLMKAS
ncbi:MAG TPA: carboxymuconolactone decarboxylase family protein [Gammaproteobacteria bacterium]|nr:carboxymuconolactone decarboxylase family protein [Gammaproteobacteria bacterium]